MREMESKLKKGDIFFGKNVSVDKYVSAVPGRLYSSKGSSSSKNKFCGGTIFVDYASDFVEIRHQCTLSATDTFKSKVEFEQAAKNCGINIEAYYTVNSVFTAKDFDEELQNSG